MVSGSVKGVAVRRFDSCPDYKIINVMKQLIKQSIIGAHLHVYDCRHGGSSCCCPVYYGW
jgi:hypothetical protein